MIEDMEYKALPIGIDSFRKLRENDYYYIDKTMMIADFLKFRDNVVLVTRPRRFGKTLNMSMLHDFFDITQDSRDIFEGLKIMDTKYAEQINSRPVVFFSLKGCSGRNMEELRQSFNDTMYPLFLHFSEIFEKDNSPKSARFDRFYKLLDALSNNEITFNTLRASLSYLVMALEAFYKKPVMLLIDEYDQPILSSYENGYREELSDFFAEFFGCVLKGNTMVSQALLTGIQRVAKESIFSRLNNISVYTVLNRQYEEYFGLTENETAKALTDYGYELDARVKGMYDGYIFGKVEIYNPWSIINYLRFGTLDTYWVNTSTNTLVRTALRQTNLLVSKEFELLLTRNSAVVPAKLEASFIELRSEGTLWGLLVNSGYLTVLEVRELIAKKLVVRIANGEVYEEFRSIINEAGNINGNMLDTLLEALIAVDMEKFEKIYKNLILTMTSSFDVAYENSYHMLTLGICSGLTRFYRITSNIEAGLGRSDIRMESTVPSYPHIILEFKLAKDESLDHAKNDAFNQIFDMKYSAGLSGKVLCVGIAHKGKECDMEYKVTEN